MLRGLCSIPSNQQADEEAEHSSDDGRPDSTVVLPPVLVEVEKLANLFPFASRGRPNIRGLELLKSFLPPEELALQMFDLFIRHASYFFRPIKADVLRDVLVPSIYNGTNTHGTSTPQENIGIADERRPECTFYPVARRPPRESASSTRSTKVYAFSRSWADVAWEEPCLRPSLRIHSHVQ